MWWFAKTKQGTPHICNQKLPRCKIISVTISCNADIRYPEEKHRLV
uniref:Uncharacterized protein n=1 Tax=Anguilla anguilla TaxID=7936 RepID=A0A0E9V5K5_ANGAN